jgi:predicted CoA-binding protein
MPSETVAILGASTDPQRYSHKAQLLLAAHGHRVIPVTPLYDQVEGVACVPGLADITVPVDTLTLYLTPKRLVPLCADIVRLQPRRVIFNPGTETPELQKALDAAGIAWEEACTLVLLRTGQF